jgi:serine/threonine protein kinase
VEPLAGDDPRQVGTFRLHARLGAGGMGRVYLGYSPGGRAVAVKVVHPELASDPQFMARFQREAQAASAVSGAYTAPVVGAGPTDRPPWLATAYVAGPSLADFAARSGSLPDAAVWRLAGGLVEALQAIHAQGLVHRDLKPGNILLASDGPRVIDFGISRALMDSQMTAAKMTLGTPAFMSPEQVEGGDVGPPSDVFALGSVLAFAATGTAPFDGGASYSIIYRVVTAEPDLSQLTEGPFGPAGPGLRAVVTACLAKDPARRPTLAQLITAIATASTAFPPVTPGSFWPRQLAAAIESRTVAIQPGQVTPVPPGPLSPAGPATPGRVAPGLTPPGPVTPVPASHPATSPARRRSGGRWMVITVAAAVVAAAAGTILALALTAGPDSTSTGGSPTAGTQSALPAATHAAPGGPIAVTVCEYPADGCGQAGFAQYMEVKPKQIVTSGDGSGYVAGIAWSGWGGARATGAGTLKVNNCTPNCAQGTYASYPATVTLAGLKRYGTGLEAYSTIVVQSPAANLDYTYTSNTVP